ncbi:hypothetical protein [Leifsonia xyli]|uniref:hypothetical protein n=1 Tax=Leifsonia xyli TaxID=1575 RepID=UPI003D6753E1
MSKIRDLVPTLAVVLSVGAALAGCTASGRAAQDARPARVVAADSHGKNPVTPEQARRFGPLRQSEARYPKNRGLSAEAVTERYAFMSTRYQQVGQLLSPDDAEFVRIYATETPAMVEATKEATSVEGTGKTVSDVHAIPAITKNFSKTGSGAGATGSVSGYQYMNYSDVPWNISGNWSAQISASGSSTVTKVTCIEHVRVYGLIGSSGIGLAYAANPSGTVSGRSNSFYRSANFTAYGAYWTMNYEADFYTSRGSFSVTG